MQTALPSSMRFVFIFYDNTLPFLFYEFGDILASRCCRLLPYMAHNPFGPYSVNVTNGRYLFYACCGELRILYIIKRNF